jgi:hypothetical protein
MVETDSTRRSEGSELAEAAAARAAPLKRRRRALLVLRSLGWALPWFALLFSVVFVLQYAFVRYQISRSIDDELKSASSQLRSELRFAEKWQIEAFRQANFFEVPNWIIVEKGGTLIDIDGFLPGLIGAVRPLPDDVYQHLYRTRFPGQLTALITPPPGGALDAQRPVSGSRGAR